MPTPSLPDYMESLSHARADEVRLLVDAIAASDPGLVGSVKWNAPSFGYEGTDRVTLRLQPGDRVDIVLHRGAAKRSDAFHFADDWDLVSWAAPDRGVVTIADRAMLESRLSDVLALVAAWLAATRD